MAMANMNLIGVFITTLWPVQALACDCGRDGSGTKNIIPPKFSNFGDIITVFHLISLIGTSVHVPLHIGQHSLIFKNVQLLGYF